MQHLRDLDRQECSATHFSDDPLVWAEMIYRAGKFQWVAYHDGVPVAAIGAAPRWGHVWNAWCLGTDDFPRVAYSLSKHVKRVMLPAVIEAGMHRADTFALKDYDKACKWLEFLGAQREAELANWGKNGETFVSYVWLREPQLKTPERTTDA
jgi:hypothetical protein